MNEENKNSPAPSGRKQRPALIYLVILFAAAFLMLLLAYFMQQRNNQELMGNLDDLRESISSFGSLDDLLEENRTLRDANRALEEELEGLKGDIAELDSARRLQNNEINALLEEADAAKAALEDAERRVRELEAELAALRGELEMPADGEG